MNTTHPQGYVTVNTWKGWCDKCECETYHIDQMWRDKQATYSRVTCADCGAVETVKVAPEPESA